MTPGQQIESELDRISAQLLAAETTAEQYRQLYAAQQALIWARNSALAASPFDVVMGRKVIAPILGGVPILVDQASGEPHPDPRWLDSGIAA